MTCRVCENPLFAGRVAFRCFCDAVTHSYCWEKHVLESHKPQFTIGTVTMDGKFMPRICEQRKGYIITKEDC